MKWTRVIGSLWFAWMSLFAFQVHAQESVCAVVKIEISQELTLERQAFEANMRITNSLDSMALEQVKIDIQFEDADGNAVLASSDPNNASASFFISLDDYTHINSVETGANGALEDGKIDPAEVAELRWLIVPTAGAGGDDGAGRLYYVGASLSFTYGGESQTIEVAPDTIVVKPQPNLTLDYFLPNEVNGDNPFTSEIEAIEPYSLGVRLSNNGSGPARSVKIASAQPKIVENKHGLLVDFRITGSFIDNQPANKTLLLDFGDIAARSDRTGRWVMETSLTGRFTEFDATFSHTDEYGGALTSLVEAVNTHFLLRDVIVALPGRDSVRDFLAQDGTTVRVYESEHTGLDLADCSDCLPVASISGVLGSASSSGSATTRTLTVPAQTGPVHIKLTDPYQGGEALTEVVRSDGSMLSPANYWLSKTIQEDKIHYDYFLNVFDTQSAGQYNVTFGGTPTVNEAPTIQYIANYTTYETGQVGFLVQASDPNKTVPTLEASGLPVGATFEDKGNGQGVFSWLPQVGQAGTYTPQFTASDGELSAVRPAMVVVFPASDRDGDGMDDDWEREYFGDLSRDGTGDLDGDGILDKDEFERDSDPTVAEIAPAAPQLAVPAYNEEVMSQTPTLSIRNGNHDNIGAVTYTFEIYENEGMTRQVGRIEGVPEAEGTTQVTLNSSVLSAGALNDNTRYYWRVNARTAAGASEWVNGRFFVNTANDAPAPFAPSKPADQTLVDTLTPTLITNNSGDLDGDTLTYQFQVFAEDDVNFSNPVAQVSGLSQGPQGQTAWRVPVSLTNGQLYFWIAAATDEHGATTVSEPASFIVSTSNLAPEVPALAAPAMDEVVMGEGATLTVNNAFDPERQPLTYHFELDAVNTFDSPALQRSEPVAEGMATTSWVVDGLLPGQTYYWRAKADDGQAQSPWMNASFRMFTDAQPPEPVTLNNPAPNAWVEVLVPTLSVHPATDPNGDAVRYEYELYSDEWMESLVASTTTDSLEWPLNTPLENHHYYFWRVRAVDEGGLASSWSETQRFFTNKDGIDDPPSLNFVLPNQAIETYGGNVPIQWVDADPDSNATVSLYYNGNHLIVADLPEDPDGESDHYLWNLDGLPAGEYRLSARISDGTTDVLAEACCVVRKVDRQIAAQVTPLTELATDESGVSVAEFSVVLDGAPRAGTTVLLNFELSTTTEAEIFGDTHYLEFTPDNWSQPQIIRVRGKDDCVVDGDQAYRLQFLPAVSTDPSFDGTVTPAVTLVNRDNEVADASLTVCGFTLVSQQTVGDSTQYDYSARLNNGGLGISGATAHATSLDPDLVVVGAADIGFPPVAAGGQALSPDILRVASPNDRAPNLGALAWNIEARRPVIESTAPPTAEAGSAYIYNVVASGQGDGALIFDVVDGPEGLTIDSSTGIVNWTPTATQEGSQKVVIEVRDALGGATRQSFTIDVAPDLTMPRIVTVDTNPEAGADYTSLAAAIASLSGPLERPVVIHARASADQPDIGRVVIQGVVPSQEKSLTIVLTKGYVLDITASENGARAVSILSPYVTLRGEGGGVQIRNNGFDGVAGIVIDQQPDDSTVIVEGLSVLGDITGTPGESAGIVALDDTADQVIRNNEISGFTGSGEAQGIFAQGQSYLYNNTVVGNRYGIRGSANSIVAFNNLATGNEWDYSPAAGNWGSFGNNISSDESSPNVSFRTRDVAFVDADSGNYALAPWDDAAVGQGRDLSNAVAFSFHNDIRQKERTAPWDIGANTVGAVSNWPPFVDSEPEVTAEENVAYQYDVQASDNDDDPLTYRLTMAPQGMSIDAQTGVVQWMPSSEQVGDFGVEIEVTDGRGGVAVQAFRLVVSPAGSNGARLIVVDTDPQTGADYSTLAAAIAGESGQELTQPLLIRARATTGLPDTQPVVIDGLGSTVKTPVTVILEQGYSLMIDALTDGTTAVMIREGDVRLLSEGGEILVRNNGYNDVTGVLIQPKAPGSVVTVDGVRVRGLMTGEPDRSAGILARQPDATYVLRNNLVTGFSGTYTNSGLDVRGPAFIYNNTLVGNRFGLRLEAAQSVVLNNLSVGNLEDYVSWAQAWAVTGHNVSTDDSSPDADFRHRSVGFVDAQAGNYGLKPWDQGARAQGLDLSTTEFYPFTTDANQKRRQTPWDVGAFGVGEVSNWPPEIVSEPVLDATEGEAYRYTVGASDPDGDPLVFELINGPDGMLMDASSGELTWTPTASQVGEHEVRVSASDRGGESAYQVYTLTVAAAPDEAPTDPVQDIIDAITDWLKDLIGGWNLGSWLGLKWF